MTTWTTPADIRAEIERLWVRGQLLASVLHRLDGAARQDDNEPAVVSRSGGPAPDPPPLIFPYRLCLRRPRPSELGASFESVRAWIRSIEAAAQTETGSGFRIEWKEVKSRELGRNLIPTALMLPSLQDALAIIDRRADADRFAELAAATLARFPGLAAWVSRKPLALLDHHADWPHILDVLDWFAAHPRSGLHARQIDVAGVDSKFIEARKGLLGELLDLVLPAGTVEHSAIGAPNFEARYGLAAKPMLVRFRLLDPRRAIAGLTDLTVRIGEFSALDIAPRRVFIVENEVTGLAFPAVDDSVLIFGGGYAVERLAAAAWLGSRTIIYWGDIDTHGFAILDRLRVPFPQTQSLLMDRATLLAHRAQWTFEAAPHVGELLHLDGEERALYDDIRFSRIGSGIRLEQERVSFGCILHACSALGACSP